MSDAGDEIIGALKDLVADTKRYMMTREPQRLEWSTEPPDAEGVWLCKWAGRIFSLNVWGNIDGTFGIHRDGERVCYVEVFAESHPNARYARIAGPEE